MPTIPNAPNGEKTVLDGTEKVPISGSFFTLLSTIKTWAFNGASIAETNTGASTTKSVTPDGLAGSNLGIKAFAVEVFSAANPITTGDGKRYIPIPAALAGMNMIRMHAILFAKSTSGTPTVQIARGRRPDATTAHSFTDMLSTRITVDANEFDSRTAAAPPVIDAAADDLADGDLLRVDVDVAGTAATGMWITFEAQLP